MKSPDFFCKFETICHQIGRFSSGRKALASFVFMTIALLATGLAEAQFYRIEYGPRPSDEIVAYREELYGAKIIYYDALKAPIRLRGTVWHNESSESKMVKGDTNPGLLPKALERSSDQLADKWYEYNLLKDTGIPLPRTQLLSEMIKNAGLQLSAEKSQRERIQKIQALLREAFPRGFFVKPREGFASKGKFPSEKTAMYNKWLSYRRTVRPQIEAMIRAGEASEDEIHLELRDRAGYVGRYIDEFLTNPEGFIVQEKVVLLKEGQNPIELRVHIAEGEILKYGAAERWENWEAIDLATTKEAQAAAAKILTALPKEFQKLSYGMDLLKGDDGKFYLIETNVGTNSGTLDPDVDVLSNQDLSRKYGGNPKILEMLERGLALDSMTEKIRIFEAIFTLPSMQYANSDNFLPSVGLLRLMGTDITKRLPSSSEPDQRLAKSFLKKYQLQHIRSAMSCRRSLLAID